MTLLSDPLWLGVVVPDRVLCMGQIELSHLNWLQINDLCSSELLEIELFDPLTVCKQMKDV